MSHQELAPMDNPINPMENMDDLISILNSNNYSVPKHKPILRPLVPKKQKIEPIVRLKNQPTDEIIVFEEEDMAVAGTTSDIAEITRKFKRKLPGNVVSGQKSNPVFFSPEKEHKKTLDVAVEQDLDKTMEKFFDSRNIVMKSRDSVAMDEDMDFDIKGNARRIKSEKQQSQDFNQDEEFELNFGNHVQNLTDFENGKIEQHPVLQKIGRVRRNYKQIRRKTDVHQNGGNSAPISKMEKYFKTNTTISHHDSDFNGHNITGEEFDHANAQMGKKFKMRQTEGGGYGIKKLKSLRTKVIRGSSRGRERSNSRNTSVSAASRFKKQNSTLNQISRSSKGGKNLRKGSRNQKIMRKTAPSSVQNRLYEADVQSYEEELMRELENEHDPNFVKQNIKLIKRSSKNTKFNIRPLKQPQKFKRNKGLDQTIRSNNKAPLNLITSSYVPYNQESSPKSSQTNLIRAQFLNENRLAKSKHILIKTFNRYLSNPNMFLKQSGGFQDLINLNHGFDDVQLAARLFRSGKDTFKRSLE